MNFKNTALKKHQKDYEKIDKALKKVLKSRVPLVEEIGNHTLLGEGKRFRPLIFVLSSRLCEYSGGNIYLLSTIFEYIHAASLLHDDVVDNADMRRKKPSANHLWGNQAAVLEGDFLFTKAVSIALSSKNTAVMYNLTQAASQMTEGQILELAHTNDWNIKKEQYMDIITAKTAVLISSACACAALYAESNEEVVNSLAKFGLNMGLAFQMIDDALDYTSSVDVFGKPVGKDLREGKVTLPLIYTLKRLKGSEKTRLQELFQNRDATDDDYEHLREVVKANGAIDQIQSEAQQYVDKAAKYLHSFSDSQPKKDLLELNQFIVERKN